MKEDNISQLGDYDAPFCDNNTRMCLLYLFVQIQIISSVQYPPNFLTF